MKKRNTPMHSMSAEQAIKIGERAVCNQFLIDSRELGPVSHELMEQSLLSALEENPGLGNYKDALEIIKSLRAR